MKHLRETRWPTSGAAWLCLSVVLFADTGGRADTRGATSVFRHENVMGTSLELRVRTDDPAVARSVERRVLQEIDRLSGVFNTYSPTSELSRWMKTRNEPVPVSGELYDVLSTAGKWRELSGGAFNPAVESLSRTWKDAARQGALPESSALEAGRRAAAVPAWELQPADRTATHSSPAPITLDGIAKGWIVERAGAAALAEAPAVHGLLLNVGGDLRHWGDAEEEIALADPRADGENAAPLGKVRLRNAALATSGGYRRHVRIGERTYSHIIDPRTGVPADGVLSASVVAGDSATADALATTLCVVAPEEIPGLTAKLAKVDWSIVRADGRRLTSPGWAAMEVKAGDRAATGVGLSAANAPARESSAKVGDHSPRGSVKDWPAGYELRVDFELNQPEGGRYARPYVAIWVEDADAYPVRTLTLWLLQGEKGQRWLADLRRWYKSDQVRSLVDATNLVSTVSAATRPPGKYNTVWNGLDDHGQPVKPGKYTLFIEAAREHGTYQLMRHDFTVGSESFAAELKGNVEIKSAAVSYRPRAAKAPAATTTGR